VKNMTNKAYLYMANSKVLKVFLDKEAADKCLAEAYKSAEILGYEPHMKNGYFMCSGNKDIYSIKVYSIAK